MGTGYLTNTQELRLCVVPPQPPPTCVRGRKSPASHESNTVTVLVLGGRPGPGSQKPPQVPLLSATMASQYISVEGEITQIISGVRKGAQREPSLAAALWDVNATVALKGGPGVRCKEGKRDGACIPPGPRRLTVAVPGGVKQKDPHNTPRRRWCSGVMASRDCGRYVCVCCGELA